MGTELWPRDETGALVSWNNLLIAGGLLGLVAAWLPERTQQPRP